MKNNWFETDSLQWCKQIDNYRFKFCQIIWLDTTSEDEHAKNAVDEFDNHCVVAAFIDLNEYDLEDVEKYIAAYGYKNVDDIVDQYLGSTNQIIAECIFEEECLSDPYVISKEILSEADAKEFAEEWMRRN